eukprot:10527045-Heterocapsa_arctica.AAC.1
MKLNQRKCVLIIMNSVHNVRYADGHNMPIMESAVYLGSHIHSSGNQHAEIKSRISSTIITLKKLNTFWNKAPTSVKWRIRVYDAIIVSKLPHGLESLCLTEADQAKLDAFQIRGLRKILGIKHSFWSKVANIISQANTRARLPVGNN